MQTRGIFLQSLGLLKAEAMHIIEPEPGFHGAELEFFFSMAEYSLDLT